jgi:hypothetical protein
VSRDLNPWIALKELRKSTTPAQRVVWLLFCLTSVYLAFLQPYIVVVPSERAKVFPGLLCAVSIAAAWIVCRERRPSLRSPEFLISVILVGLIALSSALSFTPLSSSYRGFVVIASGFGGFWCARLLLDTSSRQIVFVWLCVFLLAGIIALSLVSYATWGEIHRIVDSNPHPIADRMMLLFFAPLTLILRGRRGEILGGVALFVMAYVVFYLSSLRSAMLIPLVLGVMAVLLGALRLRYFIALLLPLVVVIALFFHQLPWIKIGPEYEPAYYRAENYPFSWHIAKEHPWLGIGLRAPRDQFLNDYEVKYPYVTKEKFAESVRRVVSSENIFLTFMAELGFPFLILYSAAVGCFLVKLVRMVRWGAQSNPVPAVALLMSVAAALLHFQVLDGLLHPQINWFFHVLLGMIPTAGEDQVSTERWQAPVFHPLGRN